MVDHQRFYDERAPRRGKELQRFYHRLLHKYYANLVPSGLKVLELGCEKGDLLAAVRPSRGLGVDLSPAMVQLARQDHPELEFQIGDAAQLQLQEKFDYIILSDVINDLQDVQRVLEVAHRCSHEKTRLVINFSNTLWQPILGLAERFNLKTRTLPQNWLSQADLENLLHLSGWEVIRAENRILWPLNTPILEPVLNRWIGPILNNCCLTIFMVARPKPDLKNSQDHTCAVIVPARNEAGTIEELVRRVPDMGLGTEIIFVEGHSKDNTWDEIHRVARLYPNRKIKVLKQQSEGKGGAVREGFAATQADLLMILDADLSVPPEELKKFYQVARDRLADFVNGVRLVYPMEDRAMRFINMIGNRFFSLAFSWLLGTPIKDTLCGTKVLFRSDYEMIARNRSYFGDFDPFGDFDLLFGAARLNLRIVDLPIRYKARTYGATNIARWKHGWLLFRMLGVAARKLKFL